MQIHNHVIKLSLCCHDQRKKYGSVKIADCILVFFWGTVLRQNNIDCFLKTYTSCLSFSICNFKSHKPGSLLISRLSCLFSSYVMGLAVSSSSSLSTSIVFFLAAILETNRKRHQQHILQITSIIP